MLLTAVGIYRKNVMFLITYVVVEFECMETSSWFLNFLKEDLEMENIHGWTINSNKHQGLVTLIKNLFPHLEHSEK